MKKQLTRDERQRFEELEVSLYSSASIPTKFGEFKVYVFHNNLDDKEHLAIVRGHIKRHDVPMRVHSECMTSEVFGSLKCDCREQLDWAYEYIANHGFGVIVYLRQEGRGIGLGNKIRAYSLQEDGYDTVEANHMLGFPDDLRRYDVAAKILKALEVKSVQLMTNNPNKILGLRELGVTIRGRIPLIIEPNPHNISYLVTKQTKSGHMLDLAMV